MDDEEPGIVGLKCEDEGAASRGLDADVGNGILDFVGDAGLDEGKAGGRGRGIACLCGLGVVIEGILCPVRNYKILVISTEIS